MLAFIFLIVCPALALVDPLDDLEAAIYGAIDKNKDGKITKLENEQFFLAFDADKDGVVTKQEFIGAIDKLEPLLVGHEDALYILLDRDNDDKVDKSNIDAVYTIADKNKDGDVSKPEFHDVFQIVVSQIIVG